MDDISELNENDDLKNLPLRCGCQSSKPKLILPLFSYTWILLLAYDVSSILSIWLALSRLTSFS